MFNLITSQVIHFIVDIREEFGDYVIDNFDISNFKELSKRITYAK